jgi:hypothetical protein
MKGESHLPVFNDTAGYQAHQHDDKDSYDKESNRSKSSSFFSDSEDDK